MPQESIAISKMNDYRFEKVLKRHYYGRVVHPKRTNGRHNWLNNLRMDMPKLKEDKVRI
jgi:hypothetical protein